MRNLRALDHLRVSGRELWGWDGDHTCGAFLVRSQIHGGDLRVIASAALEGRDVPKGYAAWGGWDHVSVSRANRCPNWPEMEQIKRLFFEDHECCMQLHVPVKDHINCHPYTLHIWRPVHVEIPRPSALMVGPSADLSDTVRDFLRDSRGSGGGAQ